MPRLQKIRVRNRRHARVKLKKNLVRLAKRLGVSLADLLAQRREAHAVGARIRSIRVAEVLRDRENNRMVKQFARSMGMGTFNRGW